MDNVMQPQEPDLADGHYDTCTERDLSFRTAGGARLMRVLMVETMQDQVTPGFTGADGRWVEPKHTLHPVKIPLFLLFVPREAATRQMQARIEQQERELHALREENFVRTREAAASAAEEKSALQQLDSERSVSQDLRRRYAKLEGDLAKVRTAIGEIELKRILGAT